VDEVHQLKAEFGDKVEWLTIYLKEAHAQDVWPLGQHVCVNDHKTSDDRIAVAKRFVETYKWQLPMITDCLEDEFLYTYLAHPERFYAFFDGKMMFKAQPKNAYFPVSDLRDWLLEHFASTQ